MNGMNWQYPSETALRMHEMLRSMATLKEIHFTTQKHSTPFFNNWDFGNNFNLPSVKVLHLEASSDWIIRYCPNVRAISLTIRKCDNRDLQRCIAATAKAATLLHLTIKFSGSMSVLELISTNFSPALAALTIQAAYCPASGGSLQPDFARFTNLRYVAYLVAYDHIGSQGKWKGSTLMWDVTARILSTCHGLKHVWLSTSSRMERMLDATEEGSRLYIPPGQVSGVVIKYISDGKQSLDDLNKVIES